MRRKTCTTWIAGVSGVLALSGLTACNSGSDDDGDGNGGTGSLTVLLEAEDTITGGLDPGQDEENIKDGWEVRYDKFIATVGNIDIQFSTDNTIQAKGADVFVIDMTTIPAAGKSLWTLDNLKTGHWEFNYSTPAASATAKLDPSVSQTDYDMMKSSGLTYFITGTLSKPDGMSCPPATLAMPGTATAAGTNSAGDPCYANTSITFTFPADAATHFGPCENDGVPGFSVSDGATQNVTATIHGDHIFFNGFPEGDEGGVLRLAQWLADCDLNLDGSVDKAELQAVAPSKLAEIDDRYQLGGSPITPLNTMWDYLRSQLKTQGHMNGEGECPFE